MFLCYMYDNTVFSTEYTVYYAWWTRDFVGLAVMEDLFLRRSCSSCLEFLKSWWLVCYDRKVHCPARQKLLGVRMETNIDFDFSLFMN